mmetsp:Transcript_13660/g.48197  ORF Transcript_13660/g.48197 Transcript_13660/m.48197 type:complete len:214 (+) Transcript_13660:424-1065(+)
MESRLGSRGWSSVPHGGIQHRAEGVRHRERGAAGSGVVRAPAVRGHSRQQEDLRQDHRGGGQMRRCGLGPRMAGCLREGVRCGQRRHGGRGGCVRQSRAPWRGRALVPGDAGAGPAARCRATQQRHRRLRTKRRARQGGRVAERHGDRARGARCDLLQQRVERLRAGRRCRGDAALARKNAGHSGSALRQIPQQPRTRIREGEPSHEGNVVFA